MKAGIHSSTPLRKAWCQTLPLELEWAQNNWPNLERVTDHINSLHKQTCMGEEKGKSITCAVSGAALTAAVEIHNEQHTAETQIIQSLQELIIKTNQKTW